MLIPNNVGRDDPARRKSDFTLAFVGGTSGSPCPTQYYSRVDLLFYKNKTKIKKINKERKKHV